MARADSGECVCFAIAETMFHLSRRRGARLARPAGLSRQLLTARRSPSAARLSPVLDHFDLHPAVDFVARRRHLST